MSHARDQARARATAAEVVASDLEYVLDRARAELAEIAGRRLLVIGGAGFLGYYFVQAALAWNEARSRSAGSRSPCSTATSAVSPTGSAATRG